MISWFTKRTKVIQCPLTTFLSICGILDVSVALWATWPTVGLSDLIGNVVAEALDSLIKMDLLSSMHSAEPLVQYELTQLLASFSSSSNIK